MRFLLSNILMFALSSAGWAMWGGEGTGGRVYDLDWVDNFRQVRLDASKTKQEGRNYPNCLEKLDLLEEIYQQVKTDVLPHQFLKDIALIYDGNRTLVALGGGEIPGYYRDHTPYFVHNGDWIFFADNRVKRSDNRAARTLEYHGEILPGTEPKVGFMPMVFEPAQPMFSRRMTLDGEGQGQFEEHFLRSQDLVYQAARVVAALGDREEGMYLTGNRQEKPKQHIVGVFRKIASLPQQFQNSASRLQLKAADDLDALANHLEFDKRGKFFNSDDYGVLHIY